MPETPLPLPRPLADVLAEWRAYRKLDRAEMLTLVEQATLLLESVYAHLPLKRAMFGIDPVQQLRSLRYRLLDQGQEIPPDHEFHAEMLRVFDGVRDLHTCYELPRPFAAYDAVLPVVIERYGPREAERYVVTRVLATSQDVQVRRGDEVTHWNGTPIAALVGRLAATRRGSNPDARYSMAVRSLTLRPLALTAPPEEDWVVLSYVPGDVAAAAPRTPCDPGARRDARLEWEAHPAMPLDGAYRDSRNRIIPRSLDRETECIRRMKAAAARDSARGVESKGGVVWGTQRSAPPPFEQILRGGEVTVDGTPCGYLRIFTFALPDVPGGRAVDRFLAEVARLLEGMPRQYLIVDVRGNPGGQFPAGERLLQMLTPEADPARRIAPEIGQMLTSPTTFQLLSNLAGVSDDERAPRLRDALRRAMEAGAVFAPGTTLTDRDECNQADLPFRYPGTTVLVVNAASTSACDVFAAGFQDHDIGPVLGTSRTTGGAGAQVATSEELRSIFEPESADPAKVTRVLRALPQGVSMSIAFRRMMRVGPNADVPLEGFGVSADYRHTLTRDDVLHQNVDLVDCALRAMRHWERRRAAGARPADDGPPPCGHGAPPPPPGATA